MEQIIKKILSGELTRANDESYANGFWDYAFDKYGEQNGEAVYYDLWELVETITGKDYDGNN